MFLNYGKVFFVKEGLKSNLLRFSIVDLAGNFTTMSEDCKRLFEIKTGTDRGPGLEFLVRGVEKTIRMKVQTRNKYLYK